MKIPSILQILAAVAVLALSAFQSGCTTNGFDSGPLTDAAVTVGVSKVITNSSAGKRAERVVALETVAAGLDNLNIGDVTRAAVDAILARAMEKDPEFRPIVRALIIGYFPDTPPAEQAGELARVAKRVADNIRAGLAFAAAGSGPPVVTVSAK
jgi:hypothetical protein